MILTLLVTFRFEGVRHTQECAVWFRKVEGNNVTYRLIRFEVDEDDSIEETLETMFPVSDFPGAKWVVAEMGDTTYDDCVAAVNVGTLDDEQKLLDAFKKDGRNYFAGPRDVIQIVPLEEIWTRVDRAAADSNFDTRDTWTLCAMYESGMLAGVGLSNTATF